MKDKLTQMHSRESTCGLFGHTLEEYREQYGDDLRLMQNYQIELYKLIDVQIEIGMRNFVSLLQPGAALWMAEYVLSQRNAIPSLGLQLHVLYTDPATHPKDDSLAKKIKHCADSATPIHSHRVFNQFRTLMERSSRMLVVERSCDADVLCSYAERAGIKVLRYAMTDLVSRE